MDVLVVVSLFLTEGPIKGAASVLDTIMINTKKKDLKAIAHCLVSRTARLSLTCRKFQMPL